MKLRFFLVFAILLITPIIQSFCGFYVSTGDTPIFNQASEVIMVRDGNQNILTMKNDFQGDVKDFAMVVPVPVVLKENDIKVIKNDVFNNLNRYSEPRLVEYYDQNPCYEEEYAVEEMVAPVEAAVDTTSAANEDKKYGVTVEAEYKVGEYQILILSATESTGLKDWLTDNKYKIPAKADEVLEPYIKQNLKFFVVKVDVAAMKKLGRTELSPIQISYSSPKFMLPIRLGMANSKGHQDLIVYAFTRNGRVECTNYRTAKITTDKNIPTFMKHKFQDFYKDLFSKQYETNGKNAVFLEYAWDLSGTNDMMCDPCTFDPPNYMDLKESGIPFVKQSNDEYGVGYVGELFFTRLHVRYERANFPNDLLFQETSNKETFQARYVMQHIAEVEIKDCAEAKNYFKEVLKRRHQELENLKDLAGWDIKQFDYYTQEIASKLGVSNNSSDGKSSSHIG